MNYVWIFLLLAGYGFSLLNGTTEQVTHNMLNSTVEAVNLCVSLLGIICFWSGLMSVAEASGLTERLGKRLSPVIIRLFPGIKSAGGSGNTVGSNAVSAIVMNLIANMFGLGNTATPLGIKAMKELQKQNHDKKVISDDMILFLVMNTAIIQLIPTTVIALRASCGSQRPAVIIPLVWISSFTEMLIAIPLAKLAVKVSKIGSHKKNKVSQKTW